MKKLLFGLAALLLILLLATVSARFWLRSDVVRATVEREATAALGMPVQIGSARVTVFPRLGLVLESARVGDPVQASVERVTVATGFGLLLRRRVEDADVQLSGGHLDASLLAGLAALGASPPSGAAVGDAPFVFESIRSVRLRDVTLIAGPERILTRLDVSFADDRLEVSNLTAEIRGVTLHLQGQLSSLSRREGHFDVRSDDLPVDALFAVFGALSQGVSARDASSPPIRITAAVSASAASLGETRVDAFETRLETTPTGIVLDPLSFTVHDGRVQSRVILDTSGQRPMVDARGDVTGLDVARLQESGPGGESAIGGRLSARFSLRGPVETSVPMLVGAARGSVDMEIRDGRMPGIEIIRQVVVRYANRSGSAPRVEGSDRFSALESSLTLETGTAGITGFEMNTADFDVRGSGTLALSSSRLSLAADVTLSEALSQQAGRDLYRYAREDKRIVLPVIIGGTLSKPTATVDIGKATGRALKNRIEEEAKSFLESIRK